MRISGSTHLGALKDGEWLCHGLAVGQDEVQHPIAIKICHCTP